MVDFELNDTQKKILGLAREFGREVLYNAEIKLDRLGDAEASARSMFSKDCWSISGPTSVPFLSGSPIGRFDQMFFSCGTSLS